MSIIIVLFVSYSEYS